MTVPPAPPVATLPPAEVRRLLESLHEVDGLFLQGLHPAAVLPPLCAAAGALVGARGAAVVALDEDGQHVRPLHGCGVLEDIPPDPFPREGSLAALALSGAGCVVENDLRRSPAAERTAALAPAATRAIVHTLDARGVPVGALLCLRSREDAPFTPTEALLLGAFARRAALAIEIARMRERDDALNRAQELRARRQDSQIRRLEELHRAGMEVASHLDLEGLLVGAVEEARGLCRARYGALGIVDAEGTGLSRFVARGLSPEEEQRLGDPPSGHGLLGALLRDGAPIRVSEPLADPRANGVPPGHPTPGPFLGVPLRVAGRVFGNLYVMGAPGDPPFDEDDERILEMLAAQAAAALENARLFAETRRLVEELETARRIRNRLQAYVSHDLRNALTGVTLWAERLEAMSGGGGEEGAAGAPGGEAVEGSPPTRRSPPASPGKDGPPGAPRHGVEAPARIAARIRRGSAHALRLARDVLDLSHLDEGTLPTWPRRVVVADLLGAAAEQILPEAERGGVGVQVLPLRQPLYLVADQDRVLQIVLNLLSNAVRVTPAGSTVELSGRSDRGGPLGEDGVAIDVSDEGPGMRSDRMEAIFGGKARPSADGEARPSGIGLPLSLSLARHMGGTLTVAATPGRGSTFTLWLPTATPEGREGWIG